MTNDNQVFIDDIRDPSWVYGFGTDSQWVVVRSGFEFTKWVETNGLPKVISYDHDLGGVDENGNEVDPATVPSGMDCAHYVVNYCLDHNVPLPECRIHTANSVGRDNLMGLLEGFAKFQKEQGLIPGEVVRVSSNHSPPKIKP